MEKINIAQLLKDCPKGMELYSPLCGNCELYDVNEYNIRIETPNKDTLISLYHDGRYCINGEIMLFPKGKTTWEGFVPPCKFKIEKGKWYVCTKDLLDNYTNKVFCKGDTYLSTQDGSLIPSNSNVPFEVLYYASEYFRDWIINDAKDDDVLVDKYNNIGIFQECEGICWHSYIYLGRDGKLRGFSIGGSHEQTDTHPATKEQRDLFSQKIKENGYKWNGETKTLKELIQPIFKAGNKIRNKNNHNIVFTITSLEEDYYACGATKALWFDDQNDYELVPNKFDINTLNLYDKVLVRDHDRTYWDITFYECYDSKNKSYPYRTLGGTVYKQCIPYKGNEHLAGFVKECSDYYKTWQNE